MYWTFQKILLTLENSFVWNTLSANPKTCGPGASHLDLVHRAEGGREPCLLRIYYMSSTTNNLIWFHFSLIITVTNMEHLVCASTVWVVYVDLLNHFSLSPKEVFWSLSFDRRGQPSTGGKLHILKDTQILSGEGSMRLSWWWHPQGRIILLIIRVKRSVSEVTSQDHTKRTLYGQSWGSFTSPYILLHQSQANKNISASRS